MPQQQWRGHQPQSEVPRRRCSGTAARPPGAPHTPHTDWAATAAVMGTLTDRGEEELATHPK
eukprot:3438216-Rhodomonas_salina.1